MKLYVVATIKQKPRVIEIHCGVNDLKARIDRIRIADSILGSVYQCKTGKNNVTLSGILPPKWWFIGELDQNLKTGEERAMDVVSLITGKVNWMLAIFL